MKTIFSIKEMVLIGIFAALTGILAQISVPLPFSPVPITFQVFAVCLSAIILGSKLGTFSQIIYLLLGAIGIPIFANFTGGMQMVLGPTGGFLIGFPIMAWIVGRFVDHNPSILKSLVGLFIGLFACYFLGVLQLSFVTKMGIQKSIMVGAVPYIPLDIIKIIIAAFLGLQVRKSLMKANLLSC